MARGGPQSIPRPESWAPGDPAPWAGEDPAPLTVELVAERVGRRAPGRQITGAPPPRRHSAVLVPLYDHGGDPHVVLTRRSWHLRSHKGEVSFPGGVQDEGETLWQTALREASEEIALPGRAVRRVGELDRLVTASSRAEIVPYVGVLDERGELAPNPDEVDAILDIALADLAHPEAYRQERWQVAPGQVRSIHFFEVEGDTIWGATANLLHQLMTAAFGLDPGLSRG